MVGGYFAGRSAETHVGMASTCASMFKLAKYASDWRRGVPFAPAEDEELSVELVAVWLFC